MARRLYAIGLRNQKVLLNVMQLQVLCVTKLKGNALQGLHMDPLRIVEPVNEMLDQLMVEIGGTSARSELAVGNLLQKVICTLRVNLC